jgi:release factor glutamine methyltransferase
LPILLVLAVFGLWILKVSRIRLYRALKLNLLVDIALNLNLPSTGCGLDLGTGTGAIALALASERQDMQWIAVDSQQGPLSWHRLIVIINS